MGRYRKVAVRIWNDAKFRTLSDDGQLAFFFVMTHPAMTSIGAMRGTMAGLAGEKGWTVPRFTKAFREALAKGMLEYDENAACVALPNFIKHNPPESPNVVKSWAVVDDLVPECRLKVRQLQRVKAFLKAFPKDSTLWLKAFRKAFPEGFPEGQQEQEQYQEQVQEQEKEQEQTTDSVPAEPVAPSRDNGVADVIAHYQRLHPRARPGDKERGLIKARLKDGYSPLDLIAAIDGCHASAHNQGQNERGRKYQTLELIVRNSSKVAQFLEQSPGGQDPDELDQYVQEVNTDV